MIKGYLTCFIFIVSILLFVSTGKSQVTTTDLSDWDGEDYKVIDKNWVFIPNQFVLSNDKVGYSNTIDIGASWNDFEMPEGKFGAVGKGTYMKTIFLPKRNTLYELDFGTISSSYVLYINDSLVKKVGDPYANEGNSVSKYNTEIINHYAKNLVLKITVHVANWEYSKGGMWSQLYLSANNYAKNKRSKRISLIFILFGGVLVMSFYHGGLYLLRRKETGFLFFFLWTLAASFRLLFSDRYYPIYDLIDLDWFWTIKLEYFSFYAAVPLFMQFIYEIFPKTISKQFIRIYNAIGLLFALSVFILNITTLTKTVIIYQGYTFIGILYMVFALVKILKKKESGSIIFAIGFLALTIAVAHDILVSNQLLSRNYWLPTGMLIFIFLQAYLLASRFTNTFSKAEVLSMQLNYMNLHLEKIVDERTEKLKEANDLLKQKNEEVSKQSDQLEIMNKELKKLSIAASETDNGIIITDKKGEIEWVNRGFEKMYGFSLSEIHKNLGSNLKNAGRGENMAELFDKAVALKKSVNYESSLESKDGEMKDVQTTLTPVLDSQGDILYLVAIDTDIGEIKRVQKELSKTISAKNKLFSIIAHDLRNPFNSLLGLTELIIEQYDSLKPEELLQFIKDLNDASKSTYALLLNLLDWSRSQRNKIEIQPADFNLKALVNDSLESFKPMLQKKQLDVEIDILEEIFVYVDKPTIETVFRNLISNAIKFSPEGKKIFISATLNAKYIEIQIKDQGVGIPKEKISLLFSLEGQYSTKGTNQEKGTGIGLMLCKDFVEKNGGEISVQSKVDVGSTFTIKLPASRI